jgi:REP element-mobilizing transposase RayT
MTTPPPLLYDQYYHIFNRGNNRENIFIEERNYLYFMELYVHHIASVANTYAYCLLRNHFHLLVCIKSESEIQTSRVIRNEVSGTRKVSSPSLQFGNFFNAYAKAINQAYARTGSLFQKPFGRILVTDNAHLLHLVRYIHYNPQKHGFVDDYRKWPYSSYPALISEKPSRLQRASILDWFNGREAFLTAHQEEIDLKPISYLLHDDL